MPWSEKRKEFYVCETGCCHYWMLSICAFLYVVSSDSCFCLSFSCAGVYSAKRTSYVRHNRVESSRSALMISLYPKVYVRMPFYIKMNCYRNYYFDSCGLQNENGSPNLSLCVCHAKLLRYDTQGPQHVCVRMTSSISCQFLLAKASRRLIHGLYPEF